MRHILTSEARLFSPKYEHKALQNAFPRVKLKRPKLISEYTDTAITLAPEHKRTPVNIASDHSPNPYHRVLKLSELFARKEE